MGTLSIVAWFVDRLPARLWMPGNNYLRARLHFCVGSPPSDEGTVRTVEWQGREIAHGINSAEELLGR